ncbi:dUTP diphosphatase [Adlercreutzia sp. ZJ304]|uniref:dUTP diphosphatase n=1 Tax=Adlercreutzia sp. ZJ304 TaxID=2709791 RepID=UPI0013EB4663|nr:dUTP diphosphatase [Adlercreutzia sp. ZJ304]
MKQLDIRIKLLRNNIEAPTYAHIGDAGLDLRSAIDVVLQPFERAIVPCGFSIAIPEGYAGLVLPRSGLATKHGITVPNSPGLIDSGYRGEMMVSLQNLDANAAYTIDVGMRIAQLVIIETPNVNLIHVDELEDTERGFGGFGSSGLN